MIPKSAIFAVLLISIITASFYTYYQNSQYKIKELTTANLAMSIAVKEQVETISILQKKYDKQATALTTLSYSTYKLYLEKDALSNKLMKHDLEELSRRKPALIETRINNGTKELFNSLTTLSTE